MMATDCSNNAAARAGSVVVRGVGSFAHGPLWRKIHALQSTVGGVPVSGASAV